jgi:RNA polymerase sigma-70 factor (ECF subfamily)
MDAELTQCIEENRPHLRAVAQRILGSSAEADDAVQEAWLRAARAGTADVQNLIGWLTTVVARVSLDMLRSRNSRREEPSDAVLTDPASEETGPEEHVLLSDAVGPAMLVVLDTLSPGERVAFVLHDLFALPFEDIAPILERSSGATRQLASRARRRVRGAAADPAADLARRRAVVEAFLAASRDGDFAGLLRLLDPDAIMRSDAVAALSGAAPFLAGADAVAQTFSGRARAARFTLIDGEPGAVWSMGGRPRVAFAMTVVEDRIITIELIADPEVLGTLELAGG